MVSNRYGLVAAGSRVGWQRVVDGVRGGDCERWIEILPRGFVCESEVRPSPLPPTGEHLPRMRAGQIVPDRFDPLEQLDPTRMLQSNLVDDSHQRVCGAMSTWRPRATRERGDVTDFAGLSLGCADSPKLPFAWAQSHRDVKGDIQVVAEPRAGAKVVRLLGPRTLVQWPHEPVSRHGFVEIAAGEWVAAKDLRVARLTPPPPWLEPGERWVDVDLDQQVLVAYEGERPVHVTLVATGTGSFPTPARTYRVEIKRSVALMEGADYRAQVPWTMYLDNVFALHSAYWHDRFGNRTSHGCINLPPLDARVLFHWTLPEVPPGWATARADVGNPGTLVRLRRGRVLNPPLTGYAREVDEARRASGR
jgi:hypothetical protein